MAYLPDHLPPLQLIVLTTLSGGPLPAGRLAAEIGAQPSKISAVKARLVAKALIEVRGRELTITDKGRKALRDHFTLQKKVAADVQWGPKPSPAPPQTDKPKE